MFGECGAAGEVCGGVGRSKVMASSREYRNFVLGQFDSVPGLADRISCRAMMGEYVLYLDGVVFGGIYDDRFLVKKLPGLSDFGMSEAIPYERGKAMWLVDEVDDVERLGEIMRVVGDGLKNN